MRAQRLLVLDESKDLSFQVERVAAGLRPRPEVVWCDSFAGVDELTAETGGFDVVIAGPMVSHDSGFRELRRLRTQSPDMKLVLAVDRWRATSLRDTVRTGALDIVRLPVSDSDLRDAIEQLLEIGPPVPVAPLPRNGPPDGRGTVIAVVSATGGCGKTFLATNVAYHLQSQLQKRTCLIDLDLQFGELSTALRLKPRYTIRDLVSFDDADDEELARRFEDYLERHESGVFVLAGPEEPADADAIEASHVTRVLDAARSRFDYVIVDTPAALSEAVLVAVEQADQVLSLATLDLPSVRNLGVLLATLKKLKVPSERVKLILNKVEPDVGIDAARVEKYFPQGFAMTIPYGREVNRSLNMGQPALAYAPRSDVSKAMESGFALGLLWGTDTDEEEAAPPRPKGRRFSLRSRKPA